MEIDIRPTLRMVQLLSRTERLAGQWDRLAASEALAGAARLREALEESCPPALALDGVSNGGLKPYLEAHLLSGEPLADPETLFNFQSRFIGAEVRTSGLVFSAPAHFFPEETVFMTTAPFLIRQRLNELLAWLKLELKTAALHPALLAGVFHLLFLQLSPYSQGNHRLSLLLVWRLLRANGMEFVAYRHFVRAVARQEKQYFYALRQAEKTARSNWSTLNAWLEFFLALLKESAERLVQSAMQEEKALNITRTQAQIMAAVSKAGSATRERIALETGIGLPTVKYNLTVLTKRGYLKRQGAGRTTSYRLL